MSISVCIATYNGAKYIEEQLTSILMQIGVNDEIIISDDNSTDDTVEIITNLNDSRIIILTSNTFKSHVSNFENALKNAKNEYIFLADQDDIWLPNKVEKTLSYLKNYDLVLSDAIIIDDDKNILHNSFFKFHSSQQGILYNLYKNSYLGCCMAFNKKILNRALPFPKKINMHDWWIGLLGEIYGNVYFLENQLVQYRRHDATLTSIYSKSKNPLYKKIGFRIIMAKSLIGKLLSSNATINK